MSLTSAPNQGTKLTPIVTAKAETKSVYKDMPFIWLGIQVPQPAYIESFQY
jgi:hypothetical protein